MVGKVHSFFKVKLFLLTYDLEPSLLVALDRLFTFDIFIGPIKIPKNKVSLSKPNLSNRIQ